MGSRRWLARLALLIPAIAGLLLGVAAPASAHAELVRTSPPAESVLPSSPSQIALTFDEGVFPAKDAIRLYDDRLNAVGVGSSFHPNGIGKVVAARVLGTLGAGTYTVTWRVTSDDGHVVSGSFEFSVGHRTTVTGSPPGTRHNSATSVLAAVARGVGYLGLVTGPGALVVTAWLWPAGFGHRRIRLLVYGGGALLVAATAFGVLVQGAAASGDSIRHAFTRTDLQLGMAERFGRAAGARLVLLVAMAWLALAGYRSRRRVPALPMTLVGMLLAATWPYAGHASVGDLVPLAFVADWVHVAAMATWLGGLAMLLLGPLRRIRRDEAAADAVPVLAAFSEWAVNAVTLLVATGVFAAWRNVRSFGALTSTHYGTLLLWKTGFVVVILAVARVSRQHAEGHGRARRVGAPPAVLRRTVLGEAGAAAVVLAITAFLTGTAQASQTYAPSFTRSGGQNGVIVTVHVDHTKVGLAHLVVTTTRGGKPQAITDIEGSLSEVDPPVGPLSLEFSAAGVGREVATVTFPDAGQWSLSLQVQTSPSNRLAVAATVQVRD